MKIYAVQNFFFNSYRKWPIEIFYACEIFMKSKTSFIFITDCCYRLSINPVTTVPPITVRPLFSRVHGLCFLTFHLIRHAKIFFSSFIQFFDSFVQTKPSTFLTNKILSIALESVIYVLRFLGRFFKSGCKSEKYNLTVKRFLYLN